jgi:NAD-dependent deacetylase
MTTLDPRALELLEDAAARSGPLLFLTGAGISAESGIPTFRGPEGYWQVGSVNYRPEELATYAAFRKMPEEVWAWYLYRRGVCRAARANAAHMALVRAEQALGDRFLLVTQNVDGLHLRAGNSAARTYEIHGNIDYARCEDEHPRLREIPGGIALDWPKAKKVGDSERALLRCCDRDRWSRPHVLFFDESYDEELFRFESTLRAAREAALVVVIGTSCATTLPSHVVSAAVSRRIPLLVINPDPSPFTEAASDLDTGAWMRGTATAHVPALVDALIERARR